MKVKVIEPTIQEESTIKRDELDDYASKSNIKRDELDDYASKSNIKRDELDDFVYKANINTNYTDLNLADVGDDDFDFFDNEDPESIVESPENQPLAYPNTPGYTPFALVNTPDVHYTTTASPETHFTPASIGISIEPEIVFKKSIQITTKNIPFSNSFYTFDFDHNQNLLA